MRIIEKKMAAAVAAGVDFSLSNTVVDAGGVCWDYKKNCWQNVAAQVYLHGNLICVVCLDGRRLYSCAGWHTVTTSSRLRALGCNCGIRSGRLVDLETGAEIPSSIVFN